MDLEAAVPRRLWFHVSVTNAENRLPTGRLFSDLSLHLEATSPFNMQSLMVNSFAYRRHKRNFAASQVRS